MRREAVLDAPILASSDDNHRSLVLHGLHGRTSPFGGLGSGVAALTGAVESALMGTEEKEAAKLLSYVLALGALVLTFLIGRYLERRDIHILPHSGVGVLIGACNAGVLRMLSGMTSTQIDNDIARGERFDADFFMVALLPPIIFDAGFNIDAPAAWRNIGPTLFLAVFGTIFSTFVVGGVLYIAGSLGLCYPLGLLASLTFGSLISATDPVSVLSVFQSIGVDDDVFAIVFGESVLNDAVAIVLTRTLLSFRGSSSQPALLRIGLAAFIFVFDFASSLAVGTAFGLALSYTLRKLDIRSSTASNDLILAIALCFAFPWASYYVAEAVQLSGIVTLLFCGMVMARFARPHLSDEAVQVLRTVFEDSATCTCTCHMRTLHSRTGDTRDLQGPCSHRGDRSVHLPRRGALLLPHPAQHRLATRNHRAGCVWPRPPSCHCWRAANQPVARAHHQHAPPG